MKKLMFALIGLIIVVANSCKTVEITSAAPPTQAQELNLTLVPWTNQIPVITDEDPISFYNEMEIKVKALTPDEKWILRDGYGEYVNNAKLDGFTVPAKTKGALMKGGISSENNILTYKICFFEEGDDTYFVWKQSLNSSFFLEKKATIYVDGIPFNVELPTGFEKNRLLWNTGYSNNTTTTERIAKGRSVSGTKEIEVKKRKK
jgi:hypothetical protein